MVWRTGFLCSLGVVVAFGCAAPTPQGASPSPELLVRQLDDPGARVAAANALVARGEAAVPALIAELTRAVDPPRVSRQREALRLLRALGPAGGVALPSLLALSPRLDLDAGGELVRTVAELAPYRPPSLAILETDVGLSDHRQGREAALDLRRLRVRAWSEGLGELPTLIAMAAEPDAHRIELAIELLARRGSAARQALPALAAVLDRRDPVVTETALRVPLRARAADAILRIDPRGALGERARAVLAKAYPEPDPPRPSERRQRQIETLLAAFNHVEQRELAATHLLALGLDGARALLQAATTLSRDPARCSCCLGVTAESGAALAELVPELAALQAMVRAEDAPSVVDALARATPYARDIVLLARTRRSSKPQVQAEIDAAFDRLQAALDVPTWLPNAAVAQQAATGRLAAVERAATILARRGKDARLALPALGTALRRDYSGQVRIVEQRGKGGRVWIPHEAPEFDWVRAVVADAVVAIADPADALVIEARAFLDRGR